MLDQLLVALEKEATDQAAALLAAARVAAGRITSEVAARLAHERAAALGARSAQLRGVAEAGLGATRRASRKTVLEARERFLNRVFETARGLLPAATGGDVYRAALPIHVAEALRAVGGEPAVIRCPERLRDIVRAAVGEARQVTVESDATARPGITLTTADGSAVVDNTLEGRLERSWGRLAIAVLARL